MRILTLSTLLFLLISCSLEEVEPQIIESYFLNKEVSNPVPAPTASELEDDYGIVMNDMKKGIYFDITEVKLKATDTYKLQVIIPDNCLYSCHKNNLGVPLYLEIELNGFNIKIPDQKVTYSDYSGTLLYTKERGEIYNGTGIISKDKKQINLKYSITNWLIDWSLTLNRK